MNPSGARGRLRTPVIEGAGAVCAVGGCVDQVYASVRAGMARISHSTVWDPRMQSIRMALFPDAALEPLTPKNGRRGLVGRFRRIVRLAGPALREAAASLVDDPRNGSLPPVPCSWGCQKRALGSLLLWTVSS